jgi:hypothetical protein
MEPLDFTKTPPRGPREKLAGVVFLARTIDKMRANLPGGNLNGYLIDYSRGLSPFLLKRIGIEQSALQAVVASAADESEVLAWIESHADLSDVEGVNAKMESLGLERMTDDDRALVYERHPGVAERPELSKFFDIFEFDDARVAAAGTAL